MLDVGTELANQMEPGDRIGLRRPDGEPVGIMDVDSVYRYNETETCDQLFGTTDDDHPGVGLLADKEPFFRRPDQSISRRYPA